jgi:hypothetical protein
MEGADGKAAGDHGFITCQRIGLADGARPDAIPNAAGGEGGHRAATPDVGSHRYSDSHFRQWQHLHRVGAHLAIRHFCSVRGSGPLWRSRNAYITLS